MEHHEDGTPNVEGKKRRKKMKTLLLGMSYGMGPNLLAQKMGVDKKEAEQIIDDFKTGFPQVQAWMDQTEHDAMTKGYVEDFWGRRRRLPDIQLPEYEVKYSKFGDNGQTFNPILGSSGTFKDNNSDEIKYYQKKIAECRTKWERDKLKAEADKKGIYIKDNTGFISTAQRQCVNARIQGGAATMTKKAMIAISKDKEINDLGFHILIGVHDELIGECPKENADKVAERLSFLMKTAVPELSVPFKCDAEIEENWYKNEYSSIISADYHEFIEDKGMSPEDAFKQICEEHSEYDAEYLRSIIE